MQDAGGAVSVHFAINRRIEFMLDIYRASAGSGKTFTLAGEYIKSLFRSDRQDSYRHALAVTFTNKATEEMKQRIMEELYNLSIAGNDSPYMGDLIDVMVEAENDKRRELGIDELVDCSEAHGDSNWKMRVRKRARGLLVAILQDYSAFRISTIDQFFQVVMRAFAREMGKIATYEVELDNDAVLSYAIDKMFADLDEESNSTLLNQLTKFAIESADEGRSWNIKKEIQQVSKVLFNDSVRDILTQSGKLPDAADVENLKKSLTEKRAILVDKIAGIGKNAMELFARHGLSPEDMKGGSRSPFKRFCLWAVQDVVNYPASFEKLPNNISEWVSSKSKSNLTAVESLYNDGMNDLVKEAISFFTTEIIEYNTINLVLPSLNTIAILGEVYKRILEYCREKNVMLLSESTLLLNRIIDGKDTPFVYEKIGTSIDNYLLDEFQDTSSLQWRNFYPLLNDSLGGSNNNLIVGDVKQSIYRWRGSDWEILNSGLADSFNANLLRKHSLINNWRSRGNIVAFNNSYFKQCAELTQSAFLARAEAGGEELLDKFNNNEVVKIYNDLKQQVPESKGGGYVEVDIVDGESSETRKETACNLLEAKIAELLSNGVQQSDIAVLVRSKDEGAMVADKLVKCGYSVVSDDSLNVGANSVVQKVVGILRNMNHPSYADKEIYDLFFERGEYEVALMDEVAVYPLYNMCEEVIRRFLTDTERENVTYLQVFLDAVLDYVTKEGSNLGGFLSWWDEDGCNRNIASPQGINAITVMTIHKSKGLSFNVVFVPFYSLKIITSGKRHDDLWTVMDNNGVKVPIAVKFSSEAVKSSFAEDYLREYLNEYIDNMNIGYVALTRPKYALYIFCLSSNDKNIDSPADVLYRFFNDNKAAALNGIETAVNGMSFSDNCMQIGSLEEVAQLIGDTHVVNDDPSVLLPDKSHFFSGPVNAERLKTLRSGNIIDEHGVRETGIAMHNVFSLIDSYDSIANACKEAYDAGLVDIEPLELQSMVLDKIQEVKSYGWFDVGIKVLNERELIDGDGRVYRPDRIIIKDNNGEPVVSVVDYKFGEYNPDSASHGKYLRQVKNYVSLIKKIGYSNVMGYLWYIKHSVVEEVK